MRRYSSHLQTKHTRRTYPPDTRLKQTATCGTCAAYKSKTAEKAAEIRVLKEKLLTAENAVKDFEAMKAKLELAERTLKKLKANLQTKDKAVEGLENTQAKLLVAETAIEHLETSRDNKADEHLCKLRDFSHQADKHKLEIKTLGIELNDASLRLQSLTSQQVHFKSLAQQRSEKLEVSQLKVSKLKNKLEQSIVQLAASERQIGTLQNKLKVETAQLKGCIDKFKNCLDVKDTQLARLGREFKGVVRELKETNAQLDTVNSEKNKLEKFCKKQSRELIKLEADYGILKTKADSMLVEVAQLQYEAAAADCDLNDLTERDDRPLKATLESANDVILRECERGIVKIGTLIG